MSAWRLPSSGTQGKGESLSRDHLSLREGSDTFNRHVCLIKSGGGQGSPHNTLVSVLGGKSINFNGAQLVSRNTTHYYASQIVSAGINRLRLSLLNFFSWTYCIAVCTRTKNLFKHVSYYTSGIVLEKKKKWEKNSCRSVLFILTSESATSCAISLPAIPLRWTRKSLEPPRVIIHMSQDFSPHPLIRDDHDAA